MCYSQGSWLGSQDLRIRVASFGHFGLGRDLSQPGRLGMKQVLVVDEIVGRLRRVDHDEAGSCTDFAIADEEFAWRFDMLRRVWHSESELSTLVVFLADIIERHLELPSCLPVLVVDDPRQLCLQGRRRIRERASARPVVGLGDWIVLGRQLRE